MSIEKYGVVLDPEKSKLAEVGETTVPEYGSPSCPQCGSVILILPRAMGGQAVHCPNCGTEPFEKKEE